MRTLTYAEAQTALSRDHVNGQHARPWTGCPVCAYVQVAPLPEWRRRAMAARDSYGLVAVRDTTGTVVL